MPVTTITIAIIIVICLCVGLIYMAQSRERARLERIRQITLFSDRYRKMQQLLHELPPQYLNNELRILVTERSIETLNDLIALKTDNSYQEALERDTAYLKQLRETNPRFAPVPVRDENAAKNVRVLLEILCRFIENLGRRNIIPAGTVSKYLNQIRFASAQSRADLFVARAEANKRNGKLRVAIHNLHNAIDAYKEVATQPQAAEAIAQYRLSIKALEGEADQQKEQVLQDSQAKLDSSSEWDNFLKDDESWKKKKDFED